MSCYKFEKNKFPAPWNTWKRVLILLNVLFEFKNIHRIQLYFNNDLMPFDKCLKNN